MTPNILNPRVQAAIALLLVTMLGTLMFLPAFVPSFAPDPDVKQTLFTLTTVAVSFYLGSSSGSARKDEQEAAVAAAQIASISQSTAQAPTVAATKENS